MELGVAITTLLGIILFGLKQWQSEKTAKEFNRADTNAQELREVLSEDDPAGAAALLADQHDRVQQALRCDPAWGNYSDEQDPTGPAVPGQREFVESAAAVQG